MDKMREEFEKFQKYGLEKKPDGSYEDRIIQRFWLVWQASRAALVFELPPEHEQAYGAYDGVELRHALKNVGIKYESPKTTNVEVDNESKK